MRASVQCCCVALLAPALASAQVARGDWASYGRDGAGSRYSPLTQITRDNVTRLAVAWTYRTGDTARTRRPAKFEATPLMVDGTLYLSTPLGRAIALDPTTGKQRWNYDAQVDRDGKWGDFANRGVSTWVDSRLPSGAPCKRRIYLTTIDARIVALDAARGMPCRDFGQNGTVDLRRGLRNSPDFVEEYQLTSPPAVIRDLLITGSSVADNNRVNAASGEVRAFDARTGALRWTWDPVPRDSTDPAWASWGQVGRTTGAANVWSVIAVDSASDLAFVPTTAPSPDYFGGERPGDNRYANSIVALRASTGKVVWSFQAVHHDLWDYDNASPPALVSLSRGGRDVPAALQATKTGQLFVLNRLSGEPIFPVEERPVPASTAPGERAAARQPFNTIIPPLSPNTLSLDSVWGATPAERDACLAQIRPLRNDGPFTPPSLEGSLVVPSNVGGAHWGGVAYDPGRHIAVVPVNRLAAFVQLIPTDRFDTAEARQNSGRLDDQYTRMRGTPYVMRRRILKAPSGLPCTPPPWGALVGINLETGAKAWEVPLGDPATLRPQLAAISKTPLGLPNLGGPIVTASGIAFIGAAIDHFLRAFDVATGRELWRGAIPAGARATPMTYEIGGKQYVVICVGGSEDWGSGDYVIAFGLSAAP